MSWAYSVSFADPAGYFLATKVQLHNKDVIFAANAQDISVTKFANFLNTLISVPWKVAAKQARIPPNPSPTWLTRRIRRLRPLM